NQPTAPKIQNTAPSALTQALVSRPAKINDNPTANTNGHAVGAGMITDSGRGVASPCCCGAVIVFSVPLPRDEVHHSQDDNPHCVHKMPIQRQHPDTLGVFLLHVTKQ